MSLFKPSPFELKMGLAVAGIVAGLGLEKIPKLNKLKSVKNLAKKSKDYGVIEGKKVIREIAYDFDPELADVISGDISQIINEAITSSEIKPKANNIEVIFLDDDDDIPLLPEHKKTT